MHLRNKLTARQAANLTDPGVYSDGGGLYVRVRPSGTRSWLYIYMIDGRRREMGLGSLLDVSLAQARDKAREARTIFLDGRDPLNERNQRQTIERLGASFGEVADELISSIEQGFRNEKHRKQWRSTIDRYAAPILAKRVDQIGTEDVLAILQPIWLDKAETASRLRGRVERVLDAATVKGLRQGDNPARWRGNLEHLLPRRSKRSVIHHAALPFAEMPAFMKQLEVQPGAAALALRWTILTAARTGETIGATWQEIDAETGLWTVPGDRMKSGKDHIVPLSTRAQTLLEQVRHDGLTGPNLLFVGPSGGQLSNMAMSMLLRRMGCEKITVHGFRSTFRDWAGDKTDFAREDIEIALAHTVGSDVERAYRRGSALEKRRVIMEGWASFCFSAFGGR